MSLFQKSVLKKYLDELDDKAIRDAYGRFKAFFFDKEIQENISLSKEEQFQEGFLRELFEDYKEQALELQSEINKTDKEIDRMVYDLYELTKEEIALVEG